MADQVHFYYMPESPPCRLVEVVASILNVPLEKHYVNLFTGEQNQEENLKLNPRHVVPFLVHGDLKLTESRAIIQYLVNRFGGQDHHLYPSDPVKRARVDEILYYDGTTLYPALSQVYRPVIVEGAPLDQKKVEAFIKTFEVLEIKLKDAASRQEKFIAGDKLTLADIAIAITMTFVEATGIDLTPHETLNNYIKHLHETIPKFKEINEGPTNNMKNFIASKLAATKTE